MACYGAVSTFTCSHFAAYMHGAKNVDSWGWRHRYQLDKSVWNLFAIELPMMDW